MTTRPLFYVDGYLYNGDYGPKFPTYSHAFRLRIAIRDYMHRHPSAFTHKDQLMIQHMHLRGPAHMRQHGNISFPEQREIILRIAAVSAGLQAVAGGRRGAAS